MIDSKYKGKFGKEVEAITPATIYTKLFQNNDLFPFDTAAKDDIASRVKPDAEGNLTAAGYKVPNGEGLSLLKDDGGVKLMSELQGFFDPNDFVGADHARIQQAVDASAGTGKYVLIQDKTEIDPIWLINEAIKLPSNVEIVISGKIKLSDLCRDNIFRSANCGVGITTVMENPLKNISIIGRGSGNIEGAENPRATGDHNKTLSVSPDRAEGETYGSDAGNPNEAQSGDWRNIGVLLANCENIKINSLKINRTHTYGISLERCKTGIVDNIYFDLYKKIMVNGVEQVTRNTDGVDIVFGGEGINVSNIYGSTGDDSVGIGSIKQADVVPGSLGAMTVTGNTTMPIGDIFNCNISNVGTNSGTNTVRLLANGGAKIYNISINGIQDKTEIYSENNSCVVIGSKTPLYESTSFDSIFRIYIENVKSQMKSRNVYIEGALKDSIISGLFQAELSTIPNFYIDPEALGVENITLINSIEK